MGPAMSSYIAGRAMHMYVCETDKIHYVVSKRYTAYYI